MTLTEFIARMIDPTADWTVEPRNSEHPAYERYEAEITKRQSKARRLAAAIVPVVREWKDEE